MDNNYWDQIDVHFCIDAYQSCQDVETACGKRLSTWAAPDLPWKQSGNEYGTSPSPEKDLGYSFSCDTITCKECIVWMESNLHHCKKCGILCVYTYCPTCAEEIVIEDNKDELQT